MERRSHLSLFTAAPLVVPVLLLAAASSAAQESAFWRGYRAGEAEARVAAWAADSTEAALRETATMAPTAFDPETRRLFRDASLALARARREWAATLDSGGDADEAEARLVALLDRKDRLYLALSLADLRRSLHASSGRGRAGCRPPSILGGVPIEGMGPPIVGPPRLDRGYPADLLPLWLGWACAHAAAREAGQSSRRAWADSAVLSAYARWRVLRDYEEHLRAGRPESFFATAEDYGRFLWYRLGATESAQAGLDSLMERHGRAAVRRALKSVMGLPTVDGLGSLDARHPLVRRHGGLTDPLELVRALLEAE